VKTPADTNSTALPDPNDRPSAASQLRHRDLSATSSETLSRLVHELEVHQVELEMQNDEMRRAQQELVESHQRYSDLYDFAPVGYLTIDRHTVIGQANLTVASMLGVERSHLLGRRFMRFVQGSSRDLLHEAQRAGNHTWSGELSLLKADGGELPVSMEMVSVEESGGVLCWRCAVTDITTRVADRLLRTSEERYRGLAEQLVDGIFVTDSQGRYVDANSAGCDMLGYALEELKTLTIPDVLAPGELPKLPEQFQRLASGRIIRNEWRFRRKNGSTFDGELVARQLPDGRLQGVVRDLTDQKRSAQALLRRLEFERFLFELSRMFISLPEAEVGVNMERGLAQVGEFLEMDRVTLLDLSRDRPEMTIAYSWNGPGVGFAPPPVIAQSALPWWVGQVLLGNVSLASYVDELPEEAAAEKEYLRQRGVASAASIPLQVGGEIAGAISFVTTRRHVTWTEELVNRLRAIGDILWNALKRREAMKALLAAQVVVRESEERFRLAMNNVAEGVCILDLDGIITYANPAAEAMFGWTSAELVGRKMHEVTHYKHPDGTPYPRAECTNIQILQAGMELSDREDTFIRKDGRFFPVVVSASPLKKDGTMVGSVVGFRDETLRRNAERAVRESEALRASEERYRGLAEQVVDGIVVTDAEGRPLDANRAACDMFGYTLDEMRALRVEEGFAAAELQKVQKAIQRAGKEALRSEWRLKRKDGSLFTAEVVGRQLPDGRLQAVIRDITERKQVEEVQRRLHELAMLSVNKATVEDMLGAIVETAIAIADADFGNIQLMDRASATLRIVAQRGFPPWWIDYWRNVPRGHGTCGTALKLEERVIVEDVERSPIFSGRDLEVQRQAGVRAVQSTPLVSRSGPLVGMLSTHLRKPGRPDPRKLRLLDLLAREAADIIQHDQAEADLGRQAALLDLAHDNIFVKDSEDRIVYWNAGSADCYGWSKDEALGKVSHELLKTQFSEPLERIHDIVRRTGHWEGELIHTTRGGRRIIVDSRWAFQPAANAEGFRTLEINYDITERKRLEQEREDDARRKDEFLAILGHELRNPLAAIHTAVQVLSGGGTSPPAVRTRMENTIARQTALMRRLVDDLLELERITRGHIELQRDPVDLADCLQRAVAAVQSAVAARNQELRLRLPSEPLAFMADTARLDQILGNLLTNATKYTPQGGRIELSGARELHDVVIRCKDNGQGIPLEYQRKIFEPFARGPKTELGYGEASVGIGLALVKQLTELHGGTISVESAGTGLGTEFTVRIPVVEPPSIPAAPERPALPHRARRARSVVLVEDNPSVAEALKAALQQAGHSVHLFADGPSALAGVSELRPDVLVIDIGLPGMDGYELAARLRQRDNTKQALCVAISGFKRRQQAGDGDKFDQYFNKPIDVRTLLALLDQPSKD
jgi:two-component system CheB/CheR fusion protein